MFIPLILALLASALAPASYPIATGTAPERIYGDSLGVEISAAAALVVDGDSGAELFTQAADEQRSIGSITKLMTALVFLDSHPAWDSVVTMVAADRQSAGTPHIKTGERVGMRDLFAAALIASDNDAAAALTRLSGKSREQFVDVMNARATALGMAHTVFADPTGLDQRNVSTARDIITLLQAALERPEILEMTTQAGYSFDIRTARGTSRSERLYTTDFLIGSPYKILGGKTGYIDASGYCLVIKTISPSGHEIYGAVLGSASMAERFSDMKAILQWAYNNYRWK